MFQSKELIIRKTGRFGTPRFDYLQLLVTEFQDTANEEYKHQILANLGNFSYDPINYEWLRQLNVPDLFLDMLTETDEKYLEFSMSGLSNMICDRKNVEIVIKNGGIPLILKQLSSTNEETVLSAITCLYYLVNPMTRGEILSRPVISAIEAYSHAPTHRLRNLAKVWLQEHAPRR